MEKPVFTNFCILAFCLFLAVAGAQMLHGRSSYTSAKIKQRELPIYCVSIDKPQVSISFDAAWGNAKLR